MSGMPKDYSEYEWRMDEPEFWEIQEDEEKDDFDPLKVDPLSPGKWIEINIPKLSRKQE